MRNRVLARRLTLTGLVLASSARADLVQGTRSALLSERSHTIDLVLAPGHATLRVRRVFENQGARHDQALVDIDLPEGAVATGLRTLGTLNGEPAWFDAELMEAEAAAAKYRELTGIGGYYPKDPALLSWRTATHLKLQVFPVAPATKKTVEYTLELPTEYEDGHDVLHLGRMGTEERAAEVIVAPADPRDTIRSHGARVAPGAHLRFAEEEPLDLVLERHEQPALSGELAVVPFGPRRVLSHARVEVSGRLSEAPRGASVVVVMDASRSIKEGEARAQKAAALAYLSHMPGAMVDVLTFDRTTSRRNGRLVPVAAAMADLARVTLARRNGSAVDAALAEAETILEASPPGPRRVVVLTDLRTRESLAPEKLRGTFAKSGAIVHIAALGEGTPSLSRSDEGRWVALARSTGGVLWYGAASADPALSAQMRATFEEWARPLRIDRLSVRTPGLAGDDLALPATMAEGEAYMLLRIDPAEMRRIVVRGELWSSPVRAELQPDVARGKLWAALAFGTDLLGSLTEPEQMRLAKLGHAVSPVTSLLAIEPGVRPSTEGLEEGGGAFGFGALHGIPGRGHTARVPRLPIFDHAAFLRGALADAWRGCGGAETSARVVVETTRAEVVDVPAVTVDASAPKGASACLREATWALELPPEFDAESARFGVDL